MNRFLKINTLIIIVLIFIACEKKTEKKTEKESIKSVFVVKPTLKNEDQNRVFNGNASSNYQTKLSFKVEGNLNYFKIQVGDEVKQKELLAKLDSKPYELRVSQIRFALKEAQASLQNARSTYERTKKLYVNQNASISDMEDARAMYNATKAKVDNINKELEYASLKLSYTKLYSPISGYIGAKYVNENENVASGTPILLISDKLIDEVRVEIPEVFINKIKKNSKVKVLFNTIKNKTFDAKITEISKYTSQNKKTYTVIAKLENSIELIKDGMSADVYFHMSNENEETKYLLPINSVLNDKDGYFVYLVEENNNKYHIKRKNIKIGKLLANSFEIVEGLNKNDLVLKAGMSAVFENMQVIVSNIKELEN